VGRPGRDDRGERGVAGIIKHIKIKLYYVPIDENNYWMAHTFYSLNVHCIFSTKERVPMLSPEVRERLWPYLGGIAKQNGVKPACIGGVADHVHLLLSLPTTIATAKIIQLIKAGWSAWIHDTFKDLRNFAWQDGCGAFSVSVSHMSETVDYIKNQAEHHRTRTFQEEYLAVLGKHNLQFEDKYLWT
jgi:REP-associated tyrosine transposase